MGGKDTLGLGRRTRREEQHSRVSGIVRRRPGIYESLINIAIPRKKRSPRFNCTQTIANRGDINEERIFSRGNFTRVAVCDRWVEFG